jgi:hypothetical protein
MYTKDLSANVPLYGQEQCVYCGAASGQMIRNGYPNPTDRQLFTQLDIWNTIQVNNSTDPADTGWATDPHGLRACLQSLSNPAGVHWAEFADVSRDAVLFDILYWMNRLEYPCAVLINQGGHWVVIVGFTTDVEPVGGSTPTLQSIIVHDPEPHNVGTDSTFSAAQWFSGPWNGAIIYSGTWINKYVAIVEPPIQKGNLKVNEVNRIGEKLLTPSQAAKYAKTWIAEMNLAKQSKFRFLGRKDAIDLTPMLVCDKIPDSKDKKDPFYYIVPFGLKSAISKGKTQLVRVCVLVNAYTGNFEEVTVFGKPMQYLQEKEALKIVADAMRIDQKKLINVSIRLMFYPGDITHVRTWPFWEIKIGDRTVYVDQLGKLYGKLLPSIPGD